MDRLIALAQHLDLEIFECAGDHYVGANQDYIDSKEQAHAEGKTSDEELDEFYKNSDFQLLQDVITNTYGNTFEYECAEYLVLDDSEADEVWDEWIENYIEENVLSELPENLRRYFDTEKFKKDCSYDGRGHTIASYDGEEHEETLDGTTYYIYRVN